LEQKRIAEEETKRLRFLYEELKRKEDEKPGSEEDSE